MNKIYFHRMYTDPVLVLDFQSLYPSIIIGKQLLDLLVF